MADETLTANKGFSLTVKFDVVGIEIRCGDDYEAQVLFDDLATRIERGEPITLKYIKPKASP